MTASRGIIGCKFFLGFPAQKCCRAHSESDSFFDTRHINIVAAREKLMQRFGVAVDDVVIEEVLRYGEADIGKQYLDTIRGTAKDYVAGIMRRLREHEYNPELMKLYAVGGGSCLIKNFAEYDPARVTINGDICATAKGYELLAQRNVGGLV